MRQRALHIAAQSGYCESARLLIDRGAKVNARDEAGCTALHYAAIARDEAMLRTLIEAGGDPNAVDKSGCTPLKPFPRP